MCTPSANLARKPPSGGGNEIGSAPAVSIRARPYSLLSSPLGLVESQDGGVLTSHCFQCRRNHFWPSPFDAAVLVPRAVGPGRLSYAYGVTSPNLCIARPICTALLLPLWLWEPAWDLRRALYRWTRRAASLAHCRPTSCGPFYAYLVFLS